MIQSIVTALVLILALALIALLFVGSLGELPDDFWVRAINYLYFHTLYILLIAITISVFLVRCFIMVALCNRADHYIFAL